MDPFAPPPRRRRPNTSTRTRVVDVDVIVDVDLEVVDHVQKCSSKLVVHDTMPITSAHLSSPQASSDQSSSSQTNNDCPTLLRGSNVHSVQQPYSAPHLSPSPLYPPSALNGNGASPKPSHDDPIIIHAIDSDALRVNSGPPNQSVRGTIDQCADDVAHLSTRSIISHSIESNAAQCTPGVSEQLLASRRVPASNSIDLTENDITNTETFFSFSAPTQTEVALSSIDVPASNGPTTNNNCLPTPSSEIRTSQQSQLKQTISPSIPPLSVPEEPSKDSPLQAKSTTQDKIARSTESSACARAENAILHPAFSEAPFRSLRVEHIPNLGNSFCDQNNALRGNDQGTGITPVLSAELITTASKKPANTIDSNLTHTVPFSADNDSLGNFQLESLQTNQENERGTSTIQRSTRGDSTADNGTDLADGSAKATADSGIGSTGDSAKAPLPCLDVLSAEPLSTENMVVDSAAVHAGESSNESGKASPEKPTSTAEPPPRVTPHHTSGQGYISHPDGVETVKKPSGCSLLDQNCLPHEGEPQKVCTTGLRQPSIEHYNTSSRNAKTVVAEVIPTGITENVSLLNDSSAPHPDGRHQKPLGPGRSGPDGCPVTTRLLQEPELGAAPDAKNKFCHYERTLRARDSLKQNEHRDSTSLSEDDVILLDSPIDLDRPDNGGDDNLIPVYTVSDDDDGEDSDIEIVRECSADSVISENVKYSMTRLHFENVAVAIPTFTRCEPPSANDMAVLQAITDVFKEDAVRMRKGHTGLNRSRTVLVVAGNIYRANKLNRFFHTHCELNAVLHGIQSRHHHARIRGNRRLEDTPFSIAFSSADIVVTTDKAVCRHCERRLLNLQDVSLVVLDTAESMWDRSHPASRFLRDHYRALPEFVRPKILAIVRRTMRPREAPPIEYNTFAKFVSSTSRGAVWKSCRGKGSRRSEHDLIDVEYIHYRDNADDTVYLQGRKISAPKSTDRRGFTALDSVVDEIGPLGVALYRNKASLKRRQKAKGSDIFRDGPNFKIQLGDDHGMLGLSQKMLSLLNELYESFRASTESDSLMAIIHAGKPVVACAVCEVINSMPVFTNLIVRVVIGNRHADVKTSPSLDGFEYCDWQGEDTDDDEVSNFASREVDVLVISENYTQGGMKRPLPACPLVIRFDGSEANPSIDGNGGRCRVIVFKDHTRRGDPTADVTAEGSMEVEEVHTQKEAQVPVPATPTSHNGSGIAIKKGAAGRADSSETNVGTYGSVSAAQTCQRPKQFASKEDRRNAGFTATEVYFCRPPSCLLGLDSQAGGRVYLYRILSYNEGTSPDSILAPTLIRSGVEDFVIALSKKLLNQDTAMSLKDYHIGCGNGASVEGSIHLIYQGLITLTREKLDKAQQYTTRVFTLMDQTYTEEEFTWDSKLAKSTNEHDPAHFSFLRRYLVLPVVSFNYKEEAKLVTGSSENSEITSSKKEDREAIIKRYFEDHSSDVTPFSSIVKVDWPAVDRLLSLCNRKNHTEELNPPESVDRCQLDRFEGRILFSSFPHESVLLAGRLQYDVCPLSTISRSRKFALNSDGTLKPSSDLAYLTKVEATEETIRRQNTVTGVRPDFIDLDENEALCPGRRNDSKTITASKTSKLIPVRWCEHNQALVPTGEQEYAEKKASRFDCERNILKKRTHWTCSVRYEIEYYFNRFYRDPITYLDQPLLLAALPRRANLSEFVSVIRGKPIPDLTADIVQSKGEKRYIVPELCRTYPVSTGMLFLPCALYFVEQHLSICELRSLFDPYVGVIGKAAHLVRAVTPSFKNNKTNYERLEFLGDSLFKLACTTRLMQRFIHEDEGTLTKERNKAVANSVLKKCGQRMKIFNYFRFHLEPDSEWKPPGTDTRATGRKLQMKAVADVVEALCGAYFEIGVLEHLENRGTAKISVKRARTETTHESDESEFNEFSDSDVQWIPDSDSEDPIEIHGDSSSEEDDEGEESKKRKRSEVGLDTCPRRFTVSSVCHGYEVGAKFLERMGALGRREPTQQELLVATIRSMYPRGAKVPIEGDNLLFPPDGRLKGSSWSQRYSKLEGILGYEFKRRHLLICSLTHGSYIKGDGKALRAETYERLEFLGDAVADFFVACHLYERYPECSPGELTDLKGNVVSNESFARVTVTNGVHNFLDHNSGTLAMEISAFVQSLPQDLTVGGDGSHSVRKKDYGEVTAPKVLGDVFEAIVGAVYVDGGLGHAWRVCSKLLRDSLRINADRERHDLHPCNELADKLRRVWGIVGEVRFIMERGLQKRKKVAVYISGEKVAAGVGTVVKRAKLLAAKNAVTFLSNEDVNSDGAKLRAKLVAKGLQRLREAQKLKE